MPFNIQNKVFMLVLMYIFWTIMIFGISKIYNICKRFGLFISVEGFSAFIVWILIFIVFNPIVFGYYHTVLTEFIAMTISVIICYLCVNYIGCNWAENKKKCIEYVCVFVFLTIFLYHIKQTLMRYCNYSDYNF